jgi:hypothetical protein
VKRATRILVPRPEQAEPGTVTGSASDSVRCLLLEEGSSQMATYRMVYGDDESGVVQETFEDINDVQREDGWVVLFRGNDAILRVQEEHVKSLERLDA